MANKSKKQKSGAMPSKKSGKAAGAGRVTKSSLASNTKMTSSRAMLQSTARGTMVNHREVVRDTFTTNPTFAVVDTIAIQPGIDRYSRGSPLGTWLPGIAKEYDYYTFKKLKFTYVTTSSSLTNGMVILSYDPNAEAVAPTTFSSALNAARCASGPVRENLTLDLTSVVSNRKLMVRNSAVSSYPLYDAGRLFVCANAGGTTNVVSGYIVVEYSVQFECPQTAPNLDSTLPVDGIGPKQVVSGSSLATGLVFPCGGADANRRADTGSAIMNAPLNQYGQRLILPYQHVVLASAWSYTSPVTNIVYNHSTAVVNMHGFVPKYSGRYRIRVQLPGDYQNKAIFGSEVLKMGSSQTLSTPLDVSPIADVIQRVDGTYSGVPTTYGVTRGFTTLEVAGNENDDLSIEYTAVGYLDTAYWYMIAVGIRQVTGVTENDTAYYKINPQLGYPYFEFEYLGSCEPVLGFTTMVE